MLCVTLTIPRALRIVSRATFSRILSDRHVGVVVRASMLSQQRTSICWPVMPSLAHASNAVLVKDGHLLTGTVIL